MLVFPSICFVTTPWSILRGGQAHCSLRYQPADTAQLRVRLFFPPQPPARLTQQTQCRKSGHKEREYKRRASGGFTCKWLNTLVVASSGKFHGGSSAKQFQPPCQRHPMEWAMARAAGPHRCGGALKDQVSREDVAVVALRREIASPSFLSRFSFVHGPSLLFFLRLLALKLSLSPFLKDTPSQSISDTLTKTFRD
ncbi:uncharacterized protein BDV17DRAFT_262381 [Aspergillus undulatus]|uniref:uncharacterized protein n=1 Tax=Aspergillus undulatus TaxID=1810928 RepID=UPI003CCD68A3